MTSQLAKSIAITYIHHLPKELPNLMSRVWIVNFAGHDYSDAEKWGEIRPVTIGYVGQGSFDRLLYDVVNGLKDSQPDDWMLPSGLTILNVIAAAVWLKMHGELRILVFDRKAEKSDYRELKLTSSHLEYLIGSLASVNKARSDSTEGS